MKKTLFTLLIISNFIISGFAQKAVDPKHENHYRDVAPIQTNQFTIEISDAHSQMEFTKIKIKITNKTADYLVLKPSEMIFKYEHGEYKPGKDDIIIPPKDYVTRNLKVTGDKQFHVEALTIIFNGFYLLSAKGTVNTAPDFALPPSVNSFTAGPFEANMLNCTKETKLTTVRFKCIYTGDNYALVDPSKVVCKLEDGREFSNLKSKSKTEILRGGEDTKFTVFYEIPSSIIDMQYANMNLVWKDAFIESKLEPLKSQQVNLVIDPGKTAGKNK